MRWFGHIRSSRHLILHRSTYPYLGRRFAINSWKQIKSLLQALIMRLGNQSELYVCILVLYALQFIHGARHMYKLNNLDR